MTQSGLGERLSSILKNVCHKNPIHNVVIDWLLNGSVAEKTDANTVIENAEEALSIVNGFNHQINPIYKKDHFYNELNKMLEKLLTENVNYEDKYTKNRKNIEIRGWLLPNYALTLNKTNSSDGINILKGFLDSSCDRKVTIYWALISILYNVTHFSPVDKRKFVDKYFDKIGSDTRGNLRITDDRIYWLFRIWYANNEDKQDSEAATINKNEIVECISQLETVRKARSHETNQTLTELFVALGCKPCLRIVKYLHNFIDNLIEKDLERFWEEKDIHMYKYLVICIRNYGAKKWKHKIEDDQENLYYKTFKLLTITRNYSSRIWNEIKLQLLKTLRVFHRTTGKKNIDELKDELLNTDLSIVFEACKTLKSIHDTEGCLKTVIDVIYTQSVKNMSFDEKRIYAISYCFKIISLKVPTLISTLKDIESSYDDYDKKNIIRKLFTEMGGLEAIKKSQQNNDIREKYMEVTSNAQVRVEKMFEKSISDAKSAFKVGLVMNIVVFMVGITLLTMSGVLAVLNDNGDNWAGVGVSSGTGFLSVVYSLFINKPSRKIRKNTNHLMRIKVIFLGYLRELTQMDQSFSKNLIENEIISQETLEGFVYKIKHSMNNALKALRWEELLNGENKTEITPDIISFGEEKPPPVKPKPSSPKVVETDIDKLLGLKDDGIHSSKSPPLGAFFDEDNNPKNTPYYRRPTPTKLRGSVSNANNNFNSAFDMESLHGETHISTSNNLSTESSRNIPKRNSEVNSISNLKKKEQKNEATNFSDSKVDRNRVLSTDIEPSSDDDEPVRYSPVYPGEHTVGACRKETEAMDYISKENVRMIIDQTEGGAIEEPIESDDESDSDIQNGNQTSMA